MYARGRGLRQDYRAAAHWYRKAAEQGNANAQSNLGLLYAEGRGVPRDHGVAADWYRKAAEQGHGRAQYNLGIMYADGRGLLTDYEAAGDWFQKAADQGVVGARQKAEEAVRAARGRDRQKEQALGDGERRACQGEFTVDGQNWWVILGTAPAATMEAAKQAYKSQMKQYHPDRSLGLSPELIQIAEQKARELNSAMEQAKRYHRLRTERHARA
jgi:TPR repeat protein